MTSDIDKTDALQTTLKQLEKKYSKGIVMRLGDTAKNNNIPVFSTGSIGLDSALGIGGFPCGRIVEIYGTESSGKTTLALHAIAEVQKKGEKALFIDTEHALDTTYAKALGVAVKDLFVCQPEYGEQALDIAEMCIRSGAIALIVIDSVSALVPETELKGEIGGHYIGGQARLMSQAMRKLTAIIHKTGAVCLFINQIRHKIGITFGSPETTSGGNALKFYASIRLDIRNIGAIKDRENKKTGQKSKIKIVKNKLAPPFKEVTFDIIYGKGISRIGEIVDISLSLGVLQKAGAWLSYEKKQLGQGREAVMQLLSRDSTLQNTLVNHIKEKLKEAY